MAFDATSPVPLLYILIYSIQCTTDRWIVVCNARRVMRCCVLTAVYARLLQRSGETVLAASSLWTSALSSEVVTIY